MKPGAAGHTIGAGQGGARLELKGLVKLYGASVAVDHVDLAIESGEFISLLGPSGSGKTTTLMMIAGFVTPTAGRILVNNHDIGTMPPEHRNVGMVFQNYALFPHMTVFDNIAFPLQMRRWSKQQIAFAVDNALSLVQLSGFERRFPRQLSGGQQQRIALARALVFRPPVLLMDEPLGALDRRLREDLQLEIKHIQTQLGLTVVYVTHDQGEALTMSDRIAIMNSGRVLQLAPPEELYQRPATPFVARFLGEVNFLSGVAIAIHGERTVIRARSGLEFEVPCQSSIRVGDLVECSLRPEQVVFATGGRELDNVVPGAIRERIYLGELTRYRVQLQTGETLLVSQQNRTTGPAPSLADEVLIGWNAYDTVIVSDVRPEASPPQGKDQAVKPQ